METPIITGQKRSKFNFMRIEIYEDRLFTKNLFLKKTIFLDDITSWTEINKKLKSGPLTWTEFTIYTPYTKYTIHSLHWNNYQEMKNHLTGGVHRDREKEAKIYNSFWR